MTGCEIPTTGKAKVKAMPVEFSQKVADAICERLAGGESLRKICADKAMPAQSTVFKKLTEDQAFAEQYALARVRQAETHADQIVDIADEAEDHQLARLRIDARKWVASKLAPKKYGDKIEHEHRGGVTLMVQDQDADL